jgi:hypothetical protein
MLAQAIVEGNANASVSGTSVINLQGFMVCLLPALVALSAHLCSHRLH